MTVASSDPSKLLISIDGKSPGSASVKLTLNQYYSTTYVYLQALADSGAASVTISAPGYAPMVTSVTLLPPSVAFDRALVSITRGSTAEIGVNLSAANPSNSIGYSSVQLSPWAPLNISIASSRPEVATVKPATLTIPAGQSHGGISVTSAAIGTTTITMTPPSGFVSSEAQAQVVVVVN